MTVSIVYNRSEFGLFNNGRFLTGANTNFTFSPIYNEGYNSSYSLLMQINNQQVLGGEFLKVDTSQYYRMFVRAKTISRSSPNNYLGYGHLGFATYDQFYNFIDLRNCGGLVNTTLTRDLNPGDTYAYVAATGWSTLPEYYYRHFMINPATHPYYSTPWGYSRIGFGDFNICYGTSITQISAGEYRLTLQNTSNVDTVMPNVGYSLPIGTPVYNGFAGGSYNYVWVPEVPETWTLYDSGWFTGENRNSSVPFRHSTKYIKFMTLANYARTETVSAKYLFSDIILLQSPIQKDLNITW